MTSPLADVIVVLGARVLPDGSPSAALQRRVARAAAAFCDGVAPALICAGGRRWNARAEAVHIREQLVRLGVDDRAVHVELFSMSTAENAYYTARLMRLLGFRSAAVVTCPWHTQRALQNFRLCGVVAHGLPASPGVSRPAADLLRVSKERLCALRDRVELFWKVSPQ